MKLDNQQKCVIKGKFPEIYKEFGDKLQIEKSMNIHDIDHYLDKDFQGQELMIMLMILKKVGMYG